MTADAFVSFYILAICTGPSPALARAHVRPLNTALAAFWASSDRNWKVRSQTMEAGTFEPTDTDLDFGALKLREGCPAKNEKPPAAEGGRVPNFAGESVKAARSALDSGVSLTVKDALPDDRWVLVESNWKVCTQEPAAGTSLNGQPVTLKAVNSRSPVPDRQSGCSRAHDAT
ncbi:PASTA domain-containing protein [Streptomyces afghaniensis]|uniref:PASTA domain-containing protein n=1 Tax=Streptomyces afghaniensis TaxID=66865 RepID=UPI0037BBD11D